MESVSSKSTTNCTPIEILPFDQNDKANVCEYINSNLDVMNFERILYSVIKA